MSHTVIIGNGIAGITAARNIRKNSDQEITIISSESKYFFSRTALMYVFMGHMRFQDTQPYESSFWKKNRINLVQEYVSKIDDVHQKIIFSNGSEMAYTSLIIASGSKSNKFGWRGQELKGVQGLYSKQDLEAMESVTQGIKNAVVVGGGLIGIELAEMLLSRGIHVDFLVRENKFWGKVLPSNDALFVMESLKHHKGLTMYYEDEIDEIIGDGKGFVQQLKTKKGRLLDCQFVGLTVGVTPNIEFVKSSNIECERGILVNRNLETSVANIYAIGDCAQMREPLKNRSAIEQVWYTGKMMGEAVAQTITGNEKEYQPGNWFNSAKFFDIEYQTYGHVSNEESTDIELFSWQHSSKFLRMTFAFQKSSHQFLGINTFGIRLRHELFDTWITQQKSIEYILENLSTANFDPEFFKEYEPDIIDKFNMDYFSNINPTKRIWWRKLLTK